jgi:hypothetical protein
MNVNVLKISDSNGIHMKHVPLYDGGQNIGSVPLVTNLDTWDGIRWRHLQAG